VKGANLPSHCTLGGMDVTQQYASTLASLSGSHFQSEVCARLQGFILSFQTIPAKPHGDAGLDAFSHKGKRGYCCYGMEPDEFKTNHQRETALTNKFKSDLRRLFELVPDKKRLRHQESPEMATILPAGKKLQHIELLANWFGSHRVLSPILTAVEEYVAASQGRYVASNVSVIVMGPDDLANRYAVDELTIARANQRAFFGSIQKAAQTITIGHGTDFDSKIALLKKIRPTHEESIDKMADVFRSDWRMAIAFDGLLDNTSPPLHRALESCRAQILARVVALMIESDESWRRLGEAGAIAREIEWKAFGQQYGDFCDVLASGEVARLIGECPISWEV
jgi:hypothetical protein